jgi:hypothetical protein
MTQATKVLDEALEVRLRQCGINDPALILRLSLCLYDGFVLVTWDDYYLAPNCLWQLVLPEKKK